MFSTSRSAEKKDPFNIYKKYVTNKNYQFKKIDINKKKDSKEVRRIILNNKFKLWSILEVNLWLVKVGILLIGVKTIV